MYSNYFFDGSTIVNAWEDTNNGLYSSITESFYATLAQVYSSPFRRFSGRLLTNEITPIDSILLREKLLSSVTVENTTTNVYLYNGYIFAGGNFNCITGQWNVDLLERYNTEVTIVTVEEVDEPPVIVVLPQLLIDESNYLLIDENNALQI
jgi:hypothetical protein